MRPSLPAERRETVKRGVALRTVEMPFARALHLAVIFRDGAQGDPEGRAGITNLAARMLLEGTRGRDALALATALEGLGAHYSAEVRHEVSILRFSLPRELFVRALPLIGELVFEAGFRAVDFERLRDQTAAFLEKELKDPRETAAKHLNALLLRGTPQARPTKGTPESVRSAELGEVKSRGNALLRAGVEAVVCGRLGRSEKEALGVLMGRFPAARSPRSPLAAVTPAEPGLYFHPWPGAVQSELRLGTPGPAPGGAEWFPFLLLNTILGGKFTSRLNLNLRETHGYTYAARSFLQERRAISCFCVSAAVATGVTVPALREMFGELDGMTAAAFDPKEVTDAAGYLSGSFHYALDSPSLYLHRVVEREALWLGPDYFRRYLDFLDRAPGFDFRRVPRTPFDRSRAVLVVVGAPAVRGRLKALGMPLREI
jgi:zinc protease